MQVLDVIMTHCTYVQSYIIMELIITKLQAKSINNKFSKLRLSVVVCKLVTPRLLGCDRRYTNEHVPSGLSTVYLCNTHSGRSIAHLYHGNQIESCAHNLV